ncbi:MAG TPA: hypothetical protein VN643_03745 [Pyrinomonadaceae bacterium]|nr:hypothetical protein [Pyrinomonadaceae bacterium]
MPITPLPVVPHSPRQLTSVSTLNRFSAPRNPIVVKGYWDRLRYVNKTGPAHGNPRVTTRQDFRFPIRPNTPLRDGRGRLLGTLAPNTRIQINKGAARVMVGPDGKRHVYEFALGTRLNNLSGSPANSRIYGSGLVRRSAIPVKERPPLRLAKSQPVKGPTTSYVITGGNPQDPKLGHRNSKNEYVSYKFGHGNPPRGYTQRNRKATDYVRRPLDGNRPPQKSYVNLLNRLPGQGRGGTATSVFRVDKNHPITFHRLKNVHSRTVKLYDAGGKKPQGSMKFLKGYVVDPKTGQKTVGWMAQKAVKPKSALKAEKKRKH